MLNCPRRNRTRWDWLSYFWFNLYDSFNNQFPTAGKSIFLLYVLVRRLAIQEVVVYQDEPSYFYIFHKSGVARIQTATCDADQVREVLPLSAWCLIDDNRRMSDVPPFTTELCRFIIVAKARKKDWFETSHVFRTRYVMKPMSLQEILLWCVLCFFSLLIFWPLIAEHM